MEMEDAEAGEEGAELAAKIEGEGEEEIKDIEPPAGGEE
jgi:hypothetical protein